MGQEEVREFISDMGYKDDVIVFESPDYSSAFVGISSDGRAVYDYDLMVEHLMITDDVTYEEAVEFIDCNTIRAQSYAGDKGPIVVNSISGWPGI